MLKRVPKRDVTFKNEELIKVIEKLEIEKKTDGNVAYGNVACINRKRISENSAAILDLSDIASDIVFYYPWLIRYSILPENLEIEETPLDQTEEQRGRLSYSTENIGNVFEDSIKLLNSSRTLFEK